MGESPSESATGSDTETTPYVPSRRPLWNNIITQFGMFLAGIAFLGLMTFGLFSLVAPRANPYVDVVGFLVIPSILIIALALMPVGIFIRSWRERRADPTLKLRFRFPKIDLNDPQQRRVAKVFLVVNFLVLPIMAVSGYHGYHYTDSVEFCGEACHVVMSPQLYAYERSAHARVACAKCHIGSGAGWYVKSKLSGTRQVLAVVRNSFSRPIAPAITELRPARETCEQCHWPKKFFGAQLRETVHYASDEENTMRRVEMLLKIGGGDESFANSEGIHRHMTLLGSMEYVATDEFLQEIPWVKWTMPTGEELIYRSDGRPSSDPPPEGHARVLDCMDCHNRPAHKFQSPMESVDVLMFAGHIDPELPFIKREAIDAILQPHASTEEAMLTISERLTSFYQENYPELFASEHVAINRAIDSIRDLYEHSFFPEMNVDWRTYPDNIGHLNSPGCFRCHDGNHQNQFGTVISHECHVCHDFLNTAGSNGEQILERGEFRHPYELGPNHEAIACDSCHTGGYAPKPSCEGCHSAEHDLYSGNVSYLEALDIDVDPDMMFESAECTDCHDVSEKHSVELVTTMCVACHDEDYAEYLSEWLDELRVARQSATASILKLESVLSATRGARADSLGAWLASSRGILDALDAAGDQHNYVVAIDAYDSLIDRANAWIEEQPQEMSSK